MDVAITKKVIAFGSKQIYLPKFTIALIRTPKLSPYEARFLVPLNFSKYDLRDYLYHAYNVKVFKIRSRVQLGHVRDTAHQPRHWFRNESKKFMTVEMETPFVWPENPEDESPWGKEEKKRQEQMVVGARGVEDMQGRRIEAEQLRTQAKQLLNGRVEVEPTKEEKEQEDEDEDKDKRKKKKVEKMTPQKAWEKMRSQKVLGR